MRILISGGIGIGKTFFCNRLCKELSYPIYKTGRHANNMEHYSFGLRQSYMELLSLCKMFETNNHNCILDRWTIDFLMWRYDKESMSILEVLNDTIIPATNKYNDIFVVSPNPPLDFYIDNINDFRNDNIRWSAFTGKYFNYLKQQNKVSDGDTVSNFEVLNFMKNWTDQLIYLTTTWLHLNKFTFVYESEIDNNNWRQSWQDVYMERILELI